MQHDDDLPEYPDGPGYQRHSEASRDGAIAAKPKKATQESRCMDFIREREHSYDHGVWGARTLLAGRAGASSPPGHPSCHDDRPGGNSGARSMIKAKNYNPKLIGRFFAGRFDRFFPGNIGDARG